MVLRNYAARGWGQAKTVAARKGNTPIGVALGSGYQALFAAMNSTQQQAVITQMKAAGITWVRMDAEWWTVQPTSGGGFNWTQPDITANAMITGGMNLVVLLNTSPTWARRTANTAPLFSPWQTPDPTSYAAYCAAAVTHYSAMGVHVYELWNEPNLDVGVGTASGWGHKSPLGFAELAKAAYPAIKAADPKSLVLGGTLATYSELGEAGTDRTGASWSAVSAGATSVTVSCANATTGDSYGLLTDTTDGWPLGTVISAVTPGVSWTVIPPAWSASFPAISAGSGKTVRVSSVQYPPDTFLTQAYAAAGGLPMWDALAIHPYTQPVMPASQLPQFGGWATVPTLRNLMINNGEGAKKIWITEIGAPSGAAVASWPSALSSATTLTVSTATAAAADSGYQVIAAGLPTGSYISAVSVAANWTVRPPTGITLITALVSGTPVTSLTVGPTPVALTIGSGTTLSVVVPLASTASNLTFTVTTSASATTSTSGNTTISVTSATPAFSYPTGSLVRGSVGQTWGSAISTGTSVAAKVLAPGVSDAYGIVDEATQAAIIAEAFRSIVSGIPANGTSPGSTRWPYVGGPVFIYCWGDNGGGAGPFGLVRIDGTAKPVLQTLTTVSQTGGV